MMFKQKDSRLSDGFVKNNGRLRFDYSLPYVFNDISECMEPFIKRCARRETCA